MVESLLLTSGEQISACSGMCFLASQADALEGNGVQEKLPGFQTRTSSKYKYSIIMCRRSSKCGTRPGCVDRELLS